MRPSSRAIATLIATLVVYPLARMWGLEIREESHSAWLDWISYAVDGLGLLVPYTAHRLIHRTSNPLDAKDKEAAAAALAELGLAPRGAAARLVGAPPPDDTHLFDDHP